MSITKQNIQSVCSYFHIVCTLFLFCSIPYFYSRFTQYGLILFFSSFAIDYIASERWKQGFKLDNTRIVSLFLLLQIGLFFIYSLFEPDSRYFSTFLEYRASFIGFAIVGLLGISDKFKLRHFAYASIVSVLACFIALYNLLPTNLESLVQIRVCRALNIGSHMTINLFFCAGMILFSKLISLSKSKIEKALGIFMILLFYALVMTSGGRIGMINANVVLVCIFLRFTISKLKILIPSAIVLLLAFSIGYIGIMSNESIKKTLRLSDRTNPREYIWQEGVNQILDAPIIGHGASTNALQMKERLLNNKELCSIEKFLISHIKEDHVYGMHPHNQIMQNWQEYGILGLFTILGLFLSLLIVSKGSLSLNLITLIIFIQLQTEVIDGGITTVGICTYIFLILALSKSNEMGKEKIGGLKWISRTPSNA